MRLRCRQLRLPRLELRRGCGRLRKDAELRDLYGQGKLRLRKLPRCRHNSLWGMPRWFHQRGDGSRSRVRTRRRGLPCGEYPEPMCQGRGGVAGILRPWLLPAGNTPWAEHIPLRLREQPDSPLRCGLKLRLKTARHRIALGAPCALVRRSMTARSATSPINNPEEASPTSAGALATVPLARARLPLFR